MTPKTQREPSIEQESIMPRALREQLIGAWKLVSYEERPVDGSPPFYPMGEKPMGIILYTPDGFMSVAHETGPHTVCVG